MASTLPPQPPPFSVYVVLPLPSTSLSPSFHFEFLFLSLSYSLSFSFVIHILSLPFFDAFFLSFIFSFPSHSNDDFKQLTRCTILVEWEPNG